MELTVETNHLKCRLSAPFKAPMPEKKTNRETNVDILLSMREMFRTDDSATLCFCFSCQALLFSNNSAVGNWGVYDVGLHWYYL